MGLRTNYVLIDYENVQPKMLDELAADHFKVIVFVGASQTKISFEAAAALQCLGDKATYVQISGNGPNALDFHIAFYVGQLALQEPTPYFHIISKDKGFDPLIEHLKGRGIGATRSREIGDIPLFKIANTKSATEKLATVLANLRQRGTSRPRTIKTLSSTINALFQKQLANDELQGMLQSLEAAGHVTINDTKVSYNLPA